MRHADSQIIRWDGRPQGDHLDQRSRGRAERPCAVFGVIPNQPDDIAKMAKRLAKHGELDFCYEAGGCGYNIYRQLTALGHSCTVAATSLIPRKPVSGSRPTGATRRSWRSCTDPAT